MQNTTRPPCYPSCPLLATGASHDHHDAPFPASHFRCLLREFHDFIRSSIRRALRTLPLGALYRQLRERCPEVALPTLAAIREALALDKETVEDLAQEVALALWAALVRGRVRSARSVVFTWVTTTTPRVVRRHSRSAALLAAVARPSDDAPDVAGGIPGCFASAPSPDEQINQESVTALAETDAAMTLTDAEREVLAPHMKGISAVEIARMLEITARAVRLRLFRARRKLRRLLG